MESPTFQSPYYSSSNLCLATADPRRSICAAGIVRIYYLAILQHSVDLTWHMGAVTLWSSFEAMIGVFTACVPNLLPLYYWVCDHVVRPLRYGETQGARATAGRSMAFENSRSPSCVDGDLTLRPKEDDEICLTSMATAKRHVSEESFSGPGIVVRSEVTQTIEDCRNVTQKSW